MRMRNFARRRAAAHAPATTQCKASPQSEAPSAPEPLAVEEPKSAVNSLQESESPTAPPNEAWTRRKRSHPREQEASNDADGAYLALQKRLRDDGSVPIAATYYCLLQSAVAQEDRIDETSWLTSSLIDLVLWRLATQYANVHFLATDFCHLHLPSIARKVASGGRRSPIELYDIRDVLGRPVDYTSTRPIVFVANVSHIHWNLLRVQFHPHAELQLFEPMGRLSSRSGISYRSVPRCVIEWLDACYPQPKSWIAHSVSAITRPQQVSGFDCGVACLLYANKCGQGQPREAINESTNQHEITTFRTELQRQLECELRPRAQTPGGVDEVQETGIVHALSRVSEPHSTSRHIDYTLRIGSVDGSLSAGGFTHTASSCSPSAFAENDIFGTMAKRQRTTLANFHAPRCVPSAATETMTRDASTLPRLTVRPLHHQYEARLSKASDENSVPDRFRPRSSSGSSPLPHKNPKRSKHIYSDRFIPSRVATKLDTGFDIHSEPLRIGFNNQTSHDSHLGGAPSNTDPRASTISGSTTSTTAPRSKDVYGSHVTSHYSMLLQSELLGLETPARTLPSDYFLSTDETDLFDPFSPPTARAMMSGASAFSFSGWSASGGSAARSVLGRCPLSNVGSQNILRFKALRQSFHSEVKTSIPFSGLSGASSSRLGGSSISSGSYSRRKFPKTPFKVLDAPSLQDDFYLNLVDWSSTNVLAVGLGSSVYLWSACTSKVTQLCDLGASDLVTSVSWSLRGTHLSVGTNNGEVQVWEVASGKKIRTMGGHVARVGTLAWNSQLIASGSRDRTIYLRDIRAAEPFSHRLTGHKQEVCGLKWSFDDNQLASGGNDNKLFVWSLHAASSGLSNGAASLPVVRFSDHTAAVKAIAWSPHQHGLLASGGGTADRCIRFWNTHTQTALHAVDTGSQVCNLMWSKNVNEVVSTHGYSLNQIIVWKYPTMTKLATMTGHTFRVLYLAMSPDGQTIVTGAGDETLRFWNAFPSSNSKSGGGRLGPGMLLPLGTSSEIR